MHDNDTIEITTYNEGTDKEYIEAEVTTFAPYNFDKVKDDPVELEVHKKQVAEQCGLEPYVMSTPYIIFSWVCNCSIDI